MQFLLLTKTEFETGVHGGLEDDYIRKVSFADQGIHSMSYHVRQLHKYLVSTKVKGKAIDRLTRHRKEPHRGTSGPERGEG